MEALIKVFERLENGIERRSWLLYEALRSAPLDEAIELARKADAFIMGTAAKGEQAARAVAPDQTNLGTVHQVDLPLRACSSLSRAIRSLI